MFAKDRQTLTMAAARTDIDPDIVLDVLTSAQRFHQDVTLTITTAQDPTITLDENERSVSTTLSALTERFEKDGVADTVPSIAQAVTDWINARPVSDAAAATHGVAALSWRNPDSTEDLAWRVVVLRDGQTREWIPTVHTRTNTITTVRVDALARAQALTFTALQAGDVTVWMHLPQPALSTAVLTCPEHIAANHNTNDELWAVFTPGRPVAIAHRSAATRLADEATDAHTVVPVSHFNRVGWV